jgi:uroporphyrinogen decarboxylase
MGYMIEGGGTKDKMTKTKAWLKNYPKDSEKLLTLLADLIVDYLQMQVKAGAQILQVFESSAEHLPREDFLAIALPHLKSIRVKLQEKLRKQGIEPVPMTVFCKGAMDSLAEQAELGYDVIGLDWTIDPVDARKIVGPNITLQGNLSPEDMYKPKEELAKLTKEMAKKFGKHRYIANLGHGITPLTPIESMSTFVDTVHTAFDD